MKSYTLDQKANHLLDYWEWDKENNSDDSKKLSVEIFAESRSLKRTTFTGWKKDPKVIARAEEIQKELECQQKEMMSQQKNMLTRLIAKNESLEINNTALLTANAERDQEIANLNEKLQLEVEKNCKPSSEFAC